ncbi:MAG: hypothetical protein J7D60_05665 [Prosthecochloris sp.]|nr:hypothetical protein [Prosthecochloris sp.]
MSCRSVDVSSRRFSCGFFYARRAGLHAVTGNRLRALYHGGKELPIDDQLTVTE